MDIYQSISKIMEEITPISKDRENKEFHFKYRGIEDVMNTLHPLLAKYKVFVVPEVLEQTREERTSKNGARMILSICKVRFTLYAEDGSFIQATTLGEGMDVSDKSTNKSMAIAMKYALFQIFCIPTEEMIDPDEESPDIGQKAKKEPPKQAPKAPPKDTINNNEIQALRDTITNLNISNEEVISALKAFNHTKLAEIKIKELQEFRKKLGA